MNNKKTEILIHVAIWAVMFIWPLMFMNHGTGATPVQFLFMSIAQLTLMVAFYVNYLWLTPKYLQRGERQFYWMFNAVMILVMGIGLHYWIELTRSLFDPNYKTSTPGPFLSVVFTLRDMFNITISAAIATTIKLSMQWKEAEDARKLAELKTLRAQINPHFLLNTLNNIYALTAFDTSKAQSAIQELSKLLRHVLYDYEEQYTSMEDEIAFLQNYINLMKIRLTNNVEVTFDAKLNTPCNARVAPLIFISLIENAFKHGVSSTCPSFIHIVITADNKKIECDIENSNFPKSHNDHSGHGIGLQQVAQRLRLLYPGKYEWTKGVDKENKIYSSKIIIYDTKLRNN